MPRTDVVRVPFQTLAQNLEVPGLGFKVFRCLKFDMRLQIHILHHRAAYIITKRYNNQSTISAFEMTSRALTITILSASYYGYKTRNPFRYLMNWKTCRQAVVTAPFITIVSVLTLLNRFFLFLGFLMQQQPIHNMNLKRILGYSAVANIIFSL